jgi:hypothetical protein
MPTRRAYCFMYDLHEDGDYTDLIQVLTKAGAVHTEFSVWLLTSNKSAREVWQEFSQYFRDGEKGVVIEIRGNYWGKSAQKLWGWIAKNVPKP